MAVAHKGICGFDPLNCSTPSLNSGYFLSSSTSNGVVKQDFSSPLAECYASDPIQDANYFCHNLAGAPPRLHGPVTSNEDYESEDNDRIRKSTLKPSMLTESQLRGETRIPSSPTNHQTKPDMDTKRTSTNLHKILFSEFNPSEAAEEERPSASINRAPALHHQTNAKKPLLSPISFTPPTDFSDSSDPVVEDSYSLSCEKGSRSRRPLANANRCVFPSPEHGQSSAHEGLPAQTSPFAKSSRSEINRIRSASLGEGLRVKPRSDRQKGCEDGNGLPSFQHGNTVIECLRRSAGSLPLKKESWIDHNSEALQPGRFDKSNISIDEHEQRRASKSRLPIDGTGGEDRIEKAHYTTVTQSPTKPKVINITRRSSVTTPPNKLPPGCISHSKSSRKAETPPNTPHKATGLGTSAERPALLPHHRTMFCDRSRAYPYTPPNSRMSTPRTKSTVRPGLPVSYQEPVSEQAATVDTQCCHSGQRLGLVVGELEATINNYPTARLYLDSPIIQYIRLFYKANASIARRVGHKSRSSVLHSRYSMFKPLCSHPTTSQLVSSYHGTRYRDDRPTSQRGSPQSSPSSLPPYFSPEARSSLPALRTIFPHAPAALLDSLQATYVALNYLSTVQTEALTPTGKRPPTPPPTSSIGSMSSVPAKALGILGIQTPVRAPAASTSWLRCASPETNVESAAEQETAELEQRSENLQVALRLLVRGLLGEIEGRRLGKKDESLVRAIGEIVRSGEDML